MDLLKQCQQWFEQDEAQKVIDTLEAIPAEERTPELDSELAKAYIAIAEIGDREPFEKALELLTPHEAYFAGDHCWNYRIASAYYYLDEEGPALRYFEKALKARPGDKDTQEYIDDCRRRLSLPRFEKNFRERTREAWAAFARIEAELRQIMDTDKTRQRGEELIEKCGNALKTALRDTSFELGFNGEKYELILSPEGLRSRLFPLVYFQKQAPESVLEHWDIRVGRQPCEGFELRAGEIKVRAEDVQMWAEKTDDQRVSLVLCCEKLTPILKEDTDKVWWALSMLVIKPSEKFPRSPLLPGLMFMLSRKTNRPCALPSCRSCCRAWDSPFGGMAATIWKTAILLTSWNRWGFRRPTGGWMSILEAAVCQCSSTTI